MDAAIEVRAAGGAVWRRDRSGTIEVLLVHRPRYDDWTLPKGKCDEGESFLACALREVREETGFLCEVGPDLIDVSYRDHKDRAKVVRYWAMEVVEGSFATNHEVDEIAWLPFPAAVAQLSYPHDRPVLRALVTSLTGLGTIGSS